MFSELLAVGGVLEEVGGALEGVAVDDWMRGADEHGAGAKGEGGTEEVVGRTVARREGVELAQRTASVTEDVDLALRGVAIDGRDIVSGEPLRHFRIAFYLLARGAFSRLYWSHGRRHSKALSASDSARSQSDEQGSEGNQ